MGSFSNPQADIGLSITGTPSRTATSGSTTIGLPRSGYILGESNLMGYAMRGIFTTGAMLSVDLRLNDTTGSDAWVAGTAQVETATAAGSITGSGNLTVTVTSAAVTGSPLAVSVAVLSGDTANDWAAKVRTTLAATTAISDKFSVGGFFANIALTRLSTGTISDIDGTEHDLYAANDGTLNIEIAAGTATNASLPIATSANTTAGVATSGVLIYDDGGVDFEGYDLVPADGLSAVLLEAFGGRFTYDCGGNEKGEMLESEKRLLVSTGAGINLLFGGLSNLEVTSVEGGAFRITVIGET